MVNQAMVPTTNSNECRPSAAAEEVTRLYAHTNMLDYSDVIVHGFLDAGRDRCIPTIHCNELTICP